MTHGDSIPCDCGNDRFELIEGIPDLGKMMVRCTECGDDIARVERPTRVEYRKFGTRPDD